MLTALGMKKVLEYVGGSHHHELSDALSGTGLYALYGGVVLYLLAHVAFKLRVVHHLQHNRLVAAVVIAVLAPVATKLPALAALAMLAAVAVGLIIFETIVYAEHRRHIRHELTHY